MNKKMYKDGKKWVVGAALAAAVAVAPAALENTTDLFGTSAVVAHAA
ncbi:MAG: KxYKxGKxW signal peptide domain-containing protein, partial [Lactobacillaceae bacterium]|nr:KxYKxGKxW signal peptide domain-containing protein [Lactobacillaceae bacterium]